MKPDYEVFAKKKTDIKEYKKIKSSESISRNKLMPVFIVKCLLIFLMGEPIVQSGLQTNLIHQ